MDAHRGPSPGPGQPWGGGAGNPYAPPPGYPGQPRVRRPGLVTATCIVVWVLAGFTVFFGLFATAIGGLGTLIEGDSIFGTDDGNWGLGVGLAVTAVGVAYILLAAMLWQGSSLGRLLLTALLVVTAAVSFPLIGDDGSPLLAVLIVIGSLVSMWLPATSRFIASRRAGMR